MAWFNCAIRRPIGANTGGMLGPNLGLVLHHAVMNGSLFGFFGSPSAQVSAHFWVAKNGTIEQYVDTNVVAWHGKQLNSRYVGVETEGCVNPPHAEPMTPQMIEGLARIYAEGAQRHGWQNKLANADGQPGFGFHRMAVNTACPCDVRLNLRQEILNKAFGSGPILGPPAPETEDDMAYVVFQSRNGLYLSNMTHFWWIRDVNQTRAIVERITGKPLMTWPDQPDTPLQFGRPADKDTADRAQVPFP